MCGRYQFTTEQCEEMRQIADAVQRRYGGRSWTPGEIRPCDRAPVLVQAAGGIEPSLMQWGYPLPGRLVINARAETAAVRPLFRGSVQSRRCLIPASGFYEWDSAKRKYLFTLPEGGPVYMAGLYDCREGLDCYCILTTQANRSMRPIHPRMPLILSGRLGRRWLSDRHSPADILAITPPELAYTSAEAQLSFW